MGENLVPKSVALNLKEQLEEGKIPSVKEAANSVGYKNINIKSPSYQKALFDYMPFDWLARQQKKQNESWRLKTLTFASENQLEDIEALCEQHDFDLVEAQGGSIRIYVGHKNKKIKKNKINKQVKMEEKLGLLDEKLFRKFHKRIQKQKKMITKIIYRNIIKKKKTLIGYGAPAKVTTFCHVFNLGVKSIEEIVDDNPLKHNRYTPGKNIKIISFKELKKIKFDYIIILAWNFAPSIIKKLRKFIRKPFKIITPFPRVTIE